MKDFKTKKALADFLEHKYRQYNKDNFIYGDPVEVPHRYTKKQDIEISAFFAAIFAWGNRTTIIAKATELMHYMHHAPHEFVLHASASDLKSLGHFKHRTFTPDDLYYFIHFLQEHYKNNDSLETAFTKWMNSKDKDIEAALVGFRKYFFSYDHLPRTLKHISSPAIKSSCKRLNMFLRWMVREAGESGIDFGIWNNIKPRQLICPLDLHVARVARRFDLLQRKQTDWQAAKELTAALSKFNAEDPVRYDIALFGLGVLEKYA